MSQNSKIYGDAYLDGHKDYALVGTDSEGKIIEAPEPSATSGTKFTYFV
jgi:hypothetical protein